VREPVVHGGPCRAIPERDATRELAARSSERSSSQKPTVRDLEDELGFAEDDVPVLLNLIDQIHGLRFELSTLLAALDELPEEARATVRMRIAARKSPSD
jgi:chaperone modulatory protein CbpM